MKKLSSLNVTFPNTYKDIPFMQEVNAEQYSNKQTGTFQSDAYWVDGNSIDLSSIPEGVNLLLSSGWHSAELETTSESDVAMTVDDDKNTVVNIVPSSDESMDIILTDHFSGNLANWTKLTCAGAVGVDLSITLIS